jgi:hypothetical protein
MTRRAVASLPLLFLLLAGCPQKTAPAEGVASEPASAGSQPAAAGSQPAVAATQPTSTPEGWVIVGSTAGFADGPTRALSEGPPLAQFNKPIRLEPFAALGLTSITPPDPVGVYVADISNHAVRRVALSGDRKRLTVLTVAGRPDAPGHRDSPTGQGEPALLNAPHGVAVSSADTVVIAEASNHTLRSAQLIATDGVEDNVWKVTTLAGKPGASGFADGKAADARFSSPHGICAHGDSIFIADIGNKRLRRLQDGVVTTVAGTGEAGSADGALEVGTMTAPIDIFCEKDGGVLIADAGTMTIRRWKEGEGLTTLTVDRPLKVPHSVTVDDAGRILVAELDGHTITEITGGKAKVVWGTGVAGAGPDQLHRPADVLVHGGYLWVADLNNHQVKARPWP